MRISWLPICAILTCAPITESVGGVFESANTLGRDITVCFVGDAVTKRPDRVQQILTWIKEFEYAANIRFTSLGACPPSKPRPNGDDIFEGDIRVVIPQTSVDATVPVPGKGCPPRENKGWGSWGAFPGGKTQHCLYILKLGDDPWRGVPYLNHTLHEFGHTLGLLHEHIRYDADLTLCSDKHIGGTRSTGLLTVYDPESVMHYSGSASCKIVGNYARTGFSEKDKLTLHILYPEDVRVAEYLGRTVVTEDENLWLIFAWKRRGALVPNVAKEFVWKIDGKVVGQASDLDMKVPAGVHALEYQYKDLLGRSYAYKGTVRVLSKQQYLETIVAPAAALSVLN